MAECKIMKCDCKHDFQDSVYGKGMRVFNPQGKGKDQGEEYICTVCGKTIGKTITKKK